MFKWVKCTKCGKSILLTNSFLCKECEIMLSLIEHLDRPLLSEDYHFNKESEEYLGLG